MRRNLVLAFFLLILNVVYSQLKENKSNEIMSFIGVGDIMLGTHFPSPQYLPPNNDPYPIISKSFDVLQSADVVFGNLEGAFLDEGKVFKRCRDTTKCYAFKTPTSYAPVLSEAGFNLLGLANNHIRDFGPAGMKSTRAMLDSLGLAYAGLIEKPFDTIRVANKLIGFCSFSPNTGTVKIGDIEGAKRIVLNLDSICDYVLVSFHGGAEGAKNQHVTRKDEMFYGENRGNVYLFAHAVIDAGADVVFGHGPHVPRSLEIYKGKFIAYSLGNFCTYSRFNLRGPNGLTPIVKVWVDEDGRFTKGRIHSFMQIKGLGLLPDPSNSVVQKMKSLTDVDFPEISHRLYIDDEGYMFVPFSKYLSTRKELFVNLKKEIVDLNLKGL